MFRRPLWYLEFAEVDFRVGQGFLQFVCNVFGGLFDDGVNLLQFVP